MTIVELAGESMALATFVVGLAYASKIRSKLTGPVHSLGPSVDAAAVLQFAGFLLHRFYSLPALGILFSLLAIGFTMPYALFRYRLWRKRPSAIQQSAAADEVRAEAS